MRKHSLGAICLSLLVAVGVMAISATAAQAKYQLRRNGASVPKLQLVANFLLSELVMENGIRLHCPEGTGIAVLEGGGTTVVTDTVLIEYKKCVWEHGETGCFIQGGTVHFAFTGALSMIGTSYFSLPTSEAFAKVRTSGTFCTIPEEEIIQGGILLEILNPETDATDHLVDIEDHGITFGGADAEFTSEAHVKEVSGGTWGIRLTGL